MKCSPTVKSGPSMTSLALLASIPSMAAVVQALTALAVTLTAIDLKKYSVFSMTCYIGMGWAIIPFARTVIETVTLAGFLLTLLGGVAYTIGSVLYGLGKRKKWMHSVFHIFVVMGSLLQFLAIFGYTL